MTNLYKNTSRIASAIVATMILSVGTAIAVTKDGGSTAHFSTTPTLQQTETIGRFVVTPNSVKFVAPATANVGRFVVSQRSAVFVPVNMLATA